VGWALAIDLGTSGCKVALVSADGLLRGAEFEPVDLVLVPGGGAEQDPDDWWRAVVTAARRTTNAHPTEAAAVTAVGVTAQWSGTVAVDGNGDHLGNAIIWMDSRGAPYVREMIRGPIRITGYGIGKALRWIRLTGGGPTKSGKDPIAHIAWLQAERPKVFEEAAVFLEPKDYLNLRMTGRAVATFDSISLYWLTDNRDPDRVHYDDRLLRLAGVDRSRLPDLIRATDVVGPVLPHVAAQLGIPPGTPVFGNTPDLQSAGIGAGTVKDYAAYLYIGTSDWLSCHVPYKATDLFHNIASLPSPLPGRYFVCNEQDNAGVCLDHLANLLIGPDADRASAYRAFDEAAARAPAGAGGVLFTPWLNGERTPVENSTLRAGFFNQSLSTGRDDLVRAVFEGVALNIRWLLETVERFTKRRLEPVTMVGGGACSDIWCQIHADVLRRSIRRTENPIMANARGAGLLALAAREEIETAEIPALVPISATYEPNPATGDLYREAYRTFRSIHKAIRPTYGRLNRPSQQVRVSGRCALREGDSPASGIGGCSRQSDGSMHRPTT
jgi:xylulokinase